MAHHIDDGRVWAVDKRTGEKRRVKRHIIRHSEHLVLAPSTRAAEKQAEQVAEPEKPKRTRSGGTKRKQAASKVAEPKTSEPAAAAEPATEPETHDSETKES